MFKITALVIVIIMLEVVFAVLRLAGVSKNVLEMARYSGFAMMAIISVMSGVIPLWAGGVVIGIPFWSESLTQLYFYRRGKKALRGDYGKEKRWVAEMVRDNDEEFMNAVSDVSTMDVREVMIIADSKQELKELVIQRSGRGDA